MRSRPLSCILLLAAALAGGCGGRAVIETLTAEQLLERADDAMSRKDWTEAVEAYERLLVQFPAHPRGQEARFRLAEAYFGRKEYVTAATEFARLSADYPAGNYADDARFRVCESYNQLSPRPQLDQEYTRAAIDHCSSLETYYPSSEYVPRAKELLAELNAKLAQKEYTTAQHYQKRGAVDSAIMYYEALVKDYPATPWAPRALLRLFEAYTGLGYREEADGAKAKLLQDYPASPEAKQVQGAAVAAQ